MALGLFVFSSSSFADSTAQETSPVGNDESWNDRSRINPNCLQGCTYDKANETLAVQVKFVERKLTAVREQLRRSEYAAALETLGDFCLETEKGGGQAQAEACYDRYLRDQTALLQKVRRSIIGNEDSHARYLSQQTSLGRGPSRGEALPGIQYSMRENEAPHRPIVSQLPSLLELQRIDEGNSQRLRGSITNQFSQWLDQYPQAPERSDFVKTRKVLRNPDRPNPNEYFTVIETDSNHSPVIDEQAYQNARRAYEHAKTQIQEDQQSYRDEANARILALTRNPRRMRSVDATSRASYAEGRGELVDLANGLVRQQAPQERRPGAVAQPAPRPSGGPPLSASVSVRAPGQDTTRPGTPVSIARTGNERVNPVTANASNQFNSNVITIDTDGLGRAIDTLNTEINGQAVPAVSAP